MTYYILCDFLRTRVRSHIKLWDELFWIGTNCIKSYQILEIENNIYVEWNKWENQKDENTNFEPYIIYSKGASSPPTATSSPIRPLILAIINQNNKVGTNYTRSYVLKPLYEA